MPDQHWIDAANGSVRLAVQRFKGPGRGVVLLHGLAGYSGEWAEVIGRMPAYDSIAPDLRGHGRSERSPSDLSPEAFCSDLVTIIGATGHEQIHLVGQSFGGHIAFLMASWHPERVASLTVIEADPEMPKPELDQQVARWLGSWDRPFADRNGALAFFGNGKSAETWADGLEKRDDGLWPRFDCDVLLNALHKLSSRQWWSDWNRITCPTLIIRGDRGELSAEVANKMAAVLPIGEVVTIAGAGHNVHLDQPALVAGRDPSTRRVHNTSIKLTDTSGTDGSLSFCPFCKCRPRTARSTSTRSG
jgi:pimeloyl-ACP methyl ester carboxylesterase